MDNSAPPSVAQLAGRFREQAAAAKEVSRAALQPLFGRGAGGRGSLGQAWRRGGWEAWYYQIRKRSHGGVPLNVRNVATAGPGQDLCQQSEVPTPVRSREDKAGS